MPGSDSRHCDIHHIALQRDRDNRERLICPDCYLVQAQQQRDQQRFEKMFQQAMIGPRFHGCSFDNYIPPCKQAENALERCRQYADTANDIVEHGNGLILCGRPGTGKNHLAAAICRSFANKGHRPLHTTALKMVRSVKETWKSKDSEQQAIAKYCEPTLLVIDEVGVQFGSDTEKMLLTEIINDRYEHVRPTILISNLTIEQLVDSLGERIIDRLRDGGTAIVFDWDSYRKNKPGTARRAS